MEKVSTEYSSLDKNIHEGLRILARIIVRKYINENMEEEGDGNCERNDSRKTFYYN